MASFYWWSSLNSAIEGVGGWGGEGGLLEWIFAGLFVVVVVVFLFSLICLICVISPINVLVNVKFNL